MSNQEKIKKKAFEYDKRSEQDKLKVEDGIDNLITYFLYTGLCIADLSRSVVFVNYGFLKEHMQAALVLS